MLRQKCSYVCVICVPVCARAGEDQGCDNVVCGINKECKLVAKMPGCYCIEDYVDVNGVCEGIYIAVYQPSAVDNALWRSALIVTIHC